MTQAPEKQLIAVDMVVTRFSPETDEFELLLIRRGNAPFKDMLAFPGGFIEPGETVEQAASRELKEETGIAVEPGRWAIVGVYSDPKRDPRGRVISLAMKVHLFEDEAAQAAVAGDDAAGAVFVAAKGFTEPLAFDHGEILIDAKVL